MTNTVQSVTNTTSKTNQHALITSEYTIEHKNNLVSVHTKHGIFKVAEELFTDFKNNSNLNFFKDYHVDACTLKLKNGITLSLNDNLDISKKGDAQIEIGGIGDSIFVSAHNADYLGIYTKNGKQENIFLAVDDSKVKLVKDANDIANPRIPVGDLEIQ